MAKRWLMALVGILAIGQPLGAHAAGCADLYPEVWQLTITDNDIGQSPQEVLSKPENAFISQFRNLDERLSIGAAPDGTPAIEMSVPQGESRIVSFHTEALGRRGPDRACISVKVFFEDGFDWSTAATKIGIGMWGGKRNKDSGGIPPELQEGWSVRLLNNRRGVRVYSYHLNRDGKRRNRPRCDPYGCLHGDVIGPATDLPLGRWVPIDLEIVMNSPGLPDGSLRLWLDGKAAIKADGLLFRDQPEWAIRGLKFTDMWGGNTNDPKNFSPKPQRHWYADYRIYAPS